MSTTNKRWLMSLCWVLSLPVYAQSAATCFLFNIGDSVSYVGGSNFYCFDSTIPTIMSMVPMPPPAVPPAKPPICGKKGGDPVDLYTGQYVQSETDMVVNDLIPISVTRAYRPQEKGGRSFGTGSALSYDMYLAGDAYTYNSGYNYLYLMLPDGSQIYYPRTAGSTLTDSIYTANTAPTQYFGSTLRNDGSYWVLQLTDGTVMQFWAQTAYGGRIPTLLKSITDRYGNQLTFTRDWRDSITRVTSPHGRYIDFTYDDSIRIVQATDNSARTVNYTYDGQGRLWTVTDPKGYTTTYTYDVNYNMQTVQDKRSNTKVVNQYVDRFGRVQMQTYADGTTNQFTYSQDPTNNLTTTDVTDGRGIVSRNIFNYSTGYITSEIRALGWPEQQTTTYVRDPNTGQIMSQTDTLGRTTTFQYDGAGNVRSVTRLAGTANAVTTSFTYTSDFNKLATITDPLLHVTTLHYDTLGNVTDVLDANSNTTTFTYTIPGKIATMTNALGKTTSFSYDVGDLVRVTDALGRSINTAMDAVGRVRETTDPLGNQTRFNHDTLDRITQVTDAMGQQTGMTYDENGNVTQVTDAKNHSHGFGYDARNHPASYTDPLTKSESYLFDGDHNVTQKTDRKGQVTNYAYDHMNRLITVTFADSSSVNYTYDAGNRITRIVDSLNGTISNSFDDLDRLTLSTTSKGSVSYTYYTNGLRNTMTVSGQPTLTYSYDAGNRLTRIDQAAGAANNNVAQSLIFNYDVANRRTQTQLANGQTVNYGYDDANQLTSITYKNANGSTAGDLSYGYDNAGRRIKIGGSFARANLTGNISNTGFDAANRLSVSNGQSLSYDLNGSLISDGTNTYTWNARNQLIAISGATTASFTYDALGRRQAKTINGVTSAYVYDGNSIVQDVNVGITYLTGLNIDETLAMQSGGATTSYLTDALGSTIRLTDGGGNKLVDYTYDAYGNTTADATVNNPFQYTGRENDGTGLYYYRARYYSPTQQRFISSDPMGLAGGINEYAYTSGNPISYRDPSGRCPWCLAGAVIGAVANTGFQLYQNGGDWGKIDIQQVGLAAAAGLLGGGLGTAAADLALGWSILANTAGGAAISGGQQVASNALNGKNLSCGVAEHAAWGAGFGLAGALGGAAYNSAVGGAAADSATNAMSGPYYPSTFSPNNIYAGGTAGGNLIGNVIGNTYQW